MEKQNKKTINLFKNNKFKYSRSTPEKKFELSEESYPMQVSDTKYYFECITKK